LNYRQLLTYKKLLVAPEQLHMLCPVIPMLDINPHGLHQDS